MKQINHTAPIRWGFTEVRQNQAKQYAGNYPGRVISVHKGGYKVLMESGELLAEPSGKLRFHAAEGTGLPTVGDFVMLDRNGNEAGTAMIHHILPRTSLFTRKGPDGEPQMIAANIDFALLCMALNQDFNLSRLERYLTVAWESGATPVVVLTKSDLCEDLPTLLAQVSSVAVGANIIVTSSLLAEGIDALLPYLGEGKTAVLTGSSGVGKSTLINRILGQEHLATGEIREDGKGRHTTTYRELIPLPSGGCIIDTPGMRELGLESGDLDKGFADITQLSEQCRFRDCSHQNEPGCAVLAAVASGELSPRRLESYHKLQKELSYEGLNSRQLEERKILSMMGSFGAMKEVRKQSRDKSNRRGR